jgi:hypothetical protein
MEKELAPLGHEVSLEVRRPHRAERRPLRRRGSSHTSIGSTMRPLEGVTVSASALLTQVAK